MAQGKFTTSPTPSNIVSAVNAMVDDIAGKAASSHNHDAGNITSGTLAVARGGTGATTVENARSNLGLATVASTGSYNDLSNKPTIPSAYKHPDSGVTAGTYRSVTVNAQGHVTGGSNPTLAIADGGTGATTASQARVNLGLNSTTGLVPTGTIIAYAGSIPNGYLACNGAAVSRTTYDALWAAIGTTYGSGNGSTTFNLPNLPKFVLDSGAVNIKTNDILTLKDIGTIAKYKSFTGFYRSSNAVNMTGLMAYSYNGVSDGTCIAMGYNSGLSAFMSINKNTNIQYIIKY